MGDELIMVSVRMPREVIERARRLASLQDRSLQAVYSRALRLGLELEEERDKIACEAIKAAERRPRSAAGRPGPEGEGE